MYKNYEKIARIVSLFVMLMSVANIAFAEAMNSSNEVKNSQAQLGLEFGITQELRDVMDNTCDDLLIPVDIWLDPIDIEEIEQNVKNQIDYNKADIRAPYDRQNFDFEIVGEYSAEQVDLYVETERRIYSEKQKEVTEQFLDNNADVENLRSARENDKIFISQYAPLVRVELTKGEIEYISNIPAVEQLFYSPEVEVIDEMNISVPLIRANYTRDTLGLNGSGVKIGIIEQTEPNLSNSYFTATNLHFDTSKSRCYSTTLTDGNHANAVAAIMVAKSTSTYPGIVPNAQLYSVYTGALAISDNVLETNIEWLLTQGVNAINYSGGFDKDPVYGSLEQWIDHIAINHSVHFIKSAGNNKNGDFKITSPGMAYNVITVGAINDNNTAFHFDDAINSSSSYMESTGPNKPDLVAPGENIITEAASVTGTSFSAPHVTAVVAQLCQKTPA